MGEHKHFASENKGDRKRKKKYKLKQKNSASLDLLNVNLTPCETAI